MVKRTADYFGLRVHLGRLSALLGIATLVLLCGCEAERPPYRTDRDGWILYPDSELPLPEPAPDCLQSEPSPAPVVIGGSLTSQQAMQPVRGRAVGAQFVLAEGPGGTARPVMVAADGSFCIEVPLAPNQSNPITLLAKSPHGCTSHPAQVTIAQQSSGETVAPPAAGGNATANLALGMPIDSRWNPDYSGNLRNLNDGNLQTSAQFSFLDFDLTDALDEAVWIRIDLERLSQLDQVRLHWAPDAGTACATGFRVLLSTALSPGLPELANSDWFMAAERVNAPCPALQAIPLGGVHARWVAVRLYEDANTSWFSAWLGQREYFNLAEIEIWGRDPNLPPPGNSFDRCP